MWNLARTAIRHTAYVIWDLIGWDADAPALPGHPLIEVGFSTCTYAAAMALSPFEHADHLREIDALRRVALGKPFVPQHP